MFCGNVLNQCEKKKTAKKKKDFKVDANSLLQITMNSKLTFFISERIYQLWKIVTLLHLLNLSLLYTVTNHFQLISS